GVDPQRRRLLAALITAGGLTGLERRDQPFGERTARFFVGARRFADHPLVREHVAGDRIAVAGDRAAPFDALRAGVLPDASGRVDDVELAVVPTIVRGRHPFHHLGRRHARAQQLEATRSVVLVDERLGRERADAALGMRAVQWPRCGRRRDWGTARRARRANAWRTRRAAARFPWAAHRRDRARRRLPRVAGALLLAAPLLLRTGVLLCAGLLLRAAGDG